MAANSPPCRRAASSSLKGDLSGGSPCLPRPVSQAEPVIPFPGFRILDLERIESGSPDGLGCNMANSEALGGQVSCPMDIWAEGQGKLVYSGSGG